MIRSFLFLAKLMVSRRYLVLSMVKRELELQYVGSLLGCVWTIMNPLVMIFIYWVVFSVGFKVQPTNGVPFVVWLTAGMAIWQLFADSVNGSSVSLPANAHLIKKTVFPSQILPIVKVLSSVVTHGAFIVLLVVLIVFQKMPLSLYYFQAFYYLFCACMLSLGIGWIVSALNVFTRDISQAAAVTLQLGFWATPIFWDISIMPTGIQQIVRLNPMFYVVDGYRQSFIYFSPFWHHPGQALYFWIVTTCILMVGALVFRKLKPHFADVL